MSRDELARAKQLLFAALGIDMAATVVVLASDFWTLGVLNDVRAGSTAMGQFTIDALEFWGAFAKIIFLTVFAVGVALTRWLGSCYRYAKETLKSSGFMHEAWKTWGWIVPFMNLFKPYQVLSEIYKAGAADYVGSEGWKKLPGSGMLLLWWIFWVITHLLMWSMSKQFLRVSLANVTLDSAVEASYLSIGVCAMSLAVAGLWFIVAGGLTHRLFGRSLNESPVAPPAAPAANLSVALAMAESSGLMDREVHSVRHSPAVTTSQSKLVASSAGVPQREAPAEELWAKALNEFDGAARRPGLWARSFAESNGNELVAKAAYLRCRVTELEAEHRTVVALHQAEEARKVKEVELAHLDNEQRAYALLPKAMCPNCDAVIPLSSEECPKCRADFGTGATWKLVPIPRI